MSHLSIILICLLFSAFFSGMEIAFISANKLKLELDKKLERFSSGILSVFLKNQGQFIATMLVGNNIALVIYGLQMAIVLENPIYSMLGNDTLTLIFQTIISTLIILLTAEFMPKTLFRINPNQWLNILSVPVMIFYIILYPVTWVFLHLSNWTLHSIFKLDPEDDNKDRVFGKVDLDQFVTENQVVENLESTTDHDIKLFQNALDFSKVKLKECMVPRTEIEALELGDSISSLRQKFIETGYSRILVYEDNIDNIIGYAHHSAIFKNPKTIKSMIKSIAIVPETMPANKLLSLFMKQNKSAAIVVDEFGGTAGLVTAEDILEEIFGEIEDEHDISDLQETRINENEFIFSGRLEIDYLNEKYELNIPVQEDYETIAGYILFEYENIPKVNERIIINPFEFKILKVSNTKIELLRLSIINPSGEKE